MTTILFPGDFFNPRQVEPDLLPEAQAAQQLPELRTAVYNHDAWLKGAALAIWPDVEPGLCLARTWMLKPEEYRRLHGELARRGARLINTPDEYERLHLFPLIYPAIQSATPKALFFDDPARVDADLVNRTFQRFMMKDDVKSVKGYDFPACIATPVTQAELDALVRRFVELRGGLFTGGIALKEFIELKRYGGATNEYRVFYLNGRVLTVSRNSKQPGNAAPLPLPLAERYAALPSHYYTVDFGETQGGEFVILETGDGQVSGLSPNQYVFKYYDEMRLALKRAIL